jgi:hypothetical protein
MSRLASHLPPDPDPPKKRNHAEAEGDEGTLEVHDYPVKLEGDYSPLLEFFGFDPNEWIVVEPVRVGKWQQSKRLENGDRDTVWLYSYRAQFRRRTPAQIMADDELDRLAARVRKPRRIPGTGLGEPVTYVHHQGDEQAGKGEGGGLEALAEREAAVLARSLEQIKRLRKAGVNIEQIADVSAGDRVENIFGHYPSQARTTATLRKQIGFAVDLDTERLEALSAFGVPIVAMRTPSNHGEMRQVIGQSPYTSASDNLDLTIADLVRRVTERTVIADQIRWEIPHDEWITTTVLSGVPVALSHGHKAKGSIGEWVRKQRDYLHFHHGVRVRVFMLGHFHHAHVEDVGGTTLIQTPSLDGGSPYFEAMTGERSAHGALGYVVGDHLRTGWDHMVIL